MTPAVTNYLERAVTALGSVGIHFNGQVEAAPVLRLLESIKHYDEEKVTVIAATLQHSAAFHRIVREQSRGLDVGPIYQMIIDDFNSIREDSAQIASWVSDGKLGPLKRLKMMFMKVVRGSIPDRFDAIEHNFLSTIGQVNKEVEREAVIRGAWQDYQMAMLGVKVMAEEVLVIAARDLEANRAHLETGNKLLEAARASGDEVKIAELEFNVSESLRRFQQEDKCYQIAKDIAEDQKTGISSAKVVLAHLEQTAVTKERLSSKLTSFFSAQQGVISGLTAAFTATMGLASATNVFKAMKKGIESSMESLANTGNVNVREAIELGYGPSLDAHPVIMLSDAIVKMQSEMNGLIADNRAKATSAANEIEEATNRNERAFAALMAKVD